MILAGLRERILLKLNRKSFYEMRWEEIWDASLWIRNMFLTTPLPPEISAELRAEIETTFEDRAVVVRSSAPGENSSRTSFAGLHESYVNVLGTAAILDHIRLVWASLWSDAASLYRQELSDKNSLSDGVSIGKNGLVCQGKVVATYSGSGLLG